MTDDKIIRAAAEAIFAEHEPAYFHQENHTRLWHALMALFTQDAVAAVAAVEPLIIEGALPDGAKWFPAEGGIMWQGQVYYPADYILTRKDVAQVRAAALRDAAESRFYNRDTGRPISGYHELHRLADAEEADHG